MKLKRVIAKYLNNNCWMCLCKWISFTFLFLAKHKHQWSFVYCKQQYGNSGEEIEWLKITKLNIFLSFASFSRIWYGFIHYIVIAQLRIFLMSNLPLWNVVKIHGPNQNHNLNEIVHSMALIIFIIIVCELWIWANGQNGWLIGRSSHRLNKMSVSIQWIPCFGVN